MRIRLYLIAFLICLCALQAGAAEEFPKPTGFVNDFAGVLDVNSGRRIEALCQELQQKTGAQVVLVTLKSLDGGDIQDIANRLFEAWGIGQKGVDNGALMLDAIEEREIWIEIGYGLEGILPDGKVGEIRDRYVVPYLKSGERGQGYFAGIAAIASVIATDAGVTLEGAPKLQPGGGSSRSVRGIGGIIPLLFLIIIMILMGRRRGGSGLWMLPFLFMGSGFGGRGGFGGGSFGGGFGGFGGGMSGGGGAGGSY